MSTSKKRKATPETDASSSRPPGKKNRLSTESSNTEDDLSSSTVSNSSYMWNPNSSLNTTPSMTDSDLSSSIFGSETAASSSSTITTRIDSSMLYNPNYQSSIREERNIKREISPKLNGTTTPRKKKPKESISALPTPPPSSEFSSVAMKMMKKMAYDEKRGLGVNAQGPTKLVEESKQKGRRGLGFEMAGFTDQTETWDFAEDPAPVEEEIHWCPQSEQPEAPLNLDEMREWIKIESKKKVIDDEIDFCDEEILKGMLLAKTVFDILPQKEMEEARARSNVYETIGPAIFLNRAAVKMANIDAVFGHMFTEPKTPNQQRSLVHPDEPFYFADLCAGPGGFSEFMLWRRKWRSKGFGFTLKGKSDFALQKFLVGTPETFDPHYGVKDIEGDGDIFKSENIDAFQNYVNKCTMGHGVHVAMADGGFSVEGQENIQEILSKQLYLCQFLTALSILRPGGNFVCKLFDIFTPFSVGLVYLMYRTFDQITIHKPVTSRPANSERYIVCKGLQEHTRNLVRTYMYEINGLQNKYRIDSESNDVQSIVPMHILKGNETFYQYIRNSNNILGEQQIRNLKKIRAFVSNSKLIDFRQKEMRSRCLQLWNVPDEPRQKYRRLHHNEVQQELFSQLDPSIEHYILRTPNPFRKSVLDQHQIQSLFDYRCVLSLGDPVLILSCGRSSVFAIDLKSRDKPWTLLEKTSFKIELPPNTLLLGERVQEQFGEGGRNSRPKSAIYIIDCYFIGGENVLMHGDRPVVFMDRYRTMKLFEKAINKPARVDLVPIRISEQLRLEQIDVQFEKLCSSGQLDQIDNEKLWFINSEIDGKPRVPVRGLWIFKFVQHPWTILLSKTRQSKYFHNQTTRASEMAAPSDSSHVASLRTMLENSFFWDFADRDDSVSKSALISFVQEKNRDLQHPHQRSNTGHTTAGN